MVNLTKIENIEDLEPVLESFDLRDFLGELYNHYRVKAEKKQLSFDLDFHFDYKIIRSYKNCLEVILQELLDNAVKFTQDGNTTLSVRQDKNNELFFTVKDTGYGIAKHERQKIFAKSYRAKDYRARELEGKGVGLYVAQILAKKINTEIKLTSRLNFGSSFGFILKAL